MVTPGPSVQVAFLLFILVFQAPLPFFPDRFFGELFVGNDHSNTRTSPCVDS